MRRLSLAEPEAEQPWHGGAGPRGERSRAAVLVGLLAGEDRRADRGGAEAAERRARGAAPGPGPAGAGGTAPAGRARRGGRRVAGASTRRRRRAPSTRAPAR